MFWNSYYKKLKKNSIQRERERERKKEREKRKRNRARKTFWQIDNEKRKIILDLAGILGELSLI